VRRSSALAWGAVVPFLIWALIRFFGLERGNLLVPLLAYTPFAALAALGACSIPILLRQWVPAAVGGIAATFLLAAVVPRTLPGDSGPSDGAPLRVLAANVHHGTADPAALVGLVREKQVDVLSIEEFTPGFERRVEAAGLRQLLPHAVLLPRKSVPGGGIYSRLPLARLPSDPSTTFRMPRASLSVSGRKLRFLSVHTFPPTHRHVDDWQRELDGLPRAGRGAPWILAGDFNATLDHAELREAIGRGYRDAADAKGRGLDFTWPAGRLFPPPVAIDHVLADDRLGIADFSVEDLPGSDHRAVLAELLVPPRGG
jgi:endonuclease/exonuclease/phosphatase (EEP) superfamily protein YafD